jgi:hypothetical protein
MIAFLGTISLLTFNDHHKHVLCSLFGVGYLRSKGIGHEMS